MNVPDEANGSPPPAPGGAPAATAPPCPRCGYVSPVASPSCPSCGVFRPAQAAANGANRRFTLGQLLGAYGVLAVCVGIGTLFPVLGAVLAALIVPALLRTARHAALRRNLGLPLESVVTLHLFFVSLVAVATLAVAACGAGALVWLGTRIVSTGGLPSRGTPGMELLGVCGGGIAALGVLWRLGPRLWRVEDEHGLPG